MNCPSCGRANRPNARFCKTCGEAMGTKRKMRFDEEPAPENSSQRPAPERTPEKNAARDTAPSESRAPEKTAARATATPEKPAPERTPEKKVQQAAQAARQVERVIQNPESLLQPASLKVGGVGLNKLQVLAGGSIVAIMAGFYGFCLYRFGWAATLTSGTPVFLAYVLGLLVALVGLRKVTDRLLNPLYRAISGIPWKLRLVAGFALPVMWCLWDTTDRQGGFQHAGMTVTIATLLGHICFRSGEFDGKPGAPVKAACTVLWVLLLSQLGYADDCSSPEDSMDTAWIGPPIKSAISTLITVAVNGKTILSKVKPGKEGDENRSCGLKVDTENSATELTMDAPEGIWLYANIIAHNPPEGYDADAQTAAIRFAGTDWIELGAPQMMGGRKAVYVKAVKRGDNPVPKASVTVTAQLFDEQQSIPVEFTLMSDLRLDVETWSEWSA